MPLVFNGYVSSPQDSHLCTFRQGQEMKNYKYMREDFCESGSHYIRFACSVYLGVYSKWYLLSTDSLLPPLLNHRSYVPDGFSAVTRFLKLFLRNCYSLEKVSESNQTKKKRHTVGFHLYKILEKTN